MSRTGDIARTIAVISAAGLSSSACLVAPGPDGIEGNEPGECTDAVDNDQDGWVDCEDVGCSDALACRDEDQDGWSVSDGDCDDDDPTTFPGASEACDGTDNDCDGTIDDPCAALPLPATEDRFQWQGRQTWFVDHDGEPCRGSVVAAMGDRALCYVDTQRELRCAGAVGDQSWGAGFSGLDRWDVEQITISPTSGDADGDGMCVLSDGTVSCRGDANDHGQFGDGTTLPASEWVTWGSSLDAVAFATGTWDQHCVLDAHGEAWCAGADYGAEPVLQASDVQTMYVDTFGMLHADDPDVWRVSDARAVVEIGPDGATFAAAELGTPGEVVHATWKQHWSWEPEIALDAICWLQSDGRIWCSAVDPVGTELLPPVPHFELAGPALALVAHPYNDALCAVIADGSMWCLGGNQDGELGVGHEDPVPEETPVLPPGSFDLRCD